MCAVQTAMTTDKACSAQPIQHRHFYTSCTAPPAGSTLHVQPTTQRKRTKMTGFMLQLIMNSLRSLQQKYSMRAYQIAGEYSDCLGVEFSVRRSHNSKRATLQRALNIMFMT
jgi:hypothetical protein